MRRQRFVGTSPDDKINAAALERDFAALVEREMHGVHILVVILCLFIVVVGAVMGYGGPNFPVYLGGIALSLATLAIIICWPHLGTKVLSTVFLPAAAGARSCEI